MFNISNKILTHLSSDPTYQSLLSLLLLPLSLSCPLSSRAPVAAELALPPAAAISFARSPRGRARALGRARMLALGAAAARTLGAGVARAGGARARGQAVALARRNRGAAAAHADAGGREMVQGRWVPILWEGRLGLRCWRALGPAAGGGGKGHGWTEAPPARSAATSRNERGEGRWEKQHTGEK